MTGRTACREKTASVKRRDGLFWIIGGLVVVAVAGMLISRSFGGGFRDIEQLGMDFVNKDARCVALLGSPISVANLKAEILGREMQLPGQALGKISGTGSDRVAVVIIPIIGPKGQCVLRINADARDGKWNLRTVSIQMQGGEALALLDESTVVL